MNIRFVRLIAPACVALTMPSFVFAQATPAPAVVTPTLDFSGIIFGNFNLRTDSASRAATGGKAPNAFTLDRAYLNFRMPAGENAQIRITPDVFQNTNNATNGYYAGWVMRLKYGYIQYTGARNGFGNGSNLTARVGILQTVVIDQMESFWPRYLGNSAVERAGYFSSADAGVSALATLGNRRGEIYATVTNGPGYTTFDRDRFKDLAVRATLTPLANGKNPILRTFAITPWVYKGWIASTFAAGGPGQVGPGENGAITAGMPRDRYGLFAGVKERRLVAAIDLSQRHDEGDSGGNTAASPRVVRDSTGRLLSGFILGRPTEWFNPTKPSPFSFVARYDHFTPSIDPSGPTYVGTTPLYEYWVLGASYDANARLTVTLDWQVQTPQDFPIQTGTNVKATPRQSTVFLHWVATF